MPALTCSAVIIPRFPSNKLKFTPLLNDAPPASYKWMCDHLSQIIWSPGLVFNLIAVWLAIVPDGKNKAASFPNKLATIFSKALTVGSCLNTSSPTLALNMACNISGEGLVTVSLIKLISIFYEDSLLSHYIYLKLIPLFAAIFLFCHPERSRRAFF